MAYILVVAFYVGIKIAGPMIDPSLITPSHKQYLNIVVFFSFVLSAAVFTQIFSISNSIGNLVDATVMMIIKFFHYVCAIIFIWLSFYCTFAGYD